jgi:hypothetical protein
MATACKSYTKTLEDSVTAADETAALSAISTVNKAQQTYAVSKEGKFATFDELVSAGYLDSRFNAEKPKIRGYVLTMAVSGKSEGDPGYTINADPEPQLKGRHFYLDSTTNVMRVNNSQVAGPSDTPINP